MSRTLTGRRPAWPLPWGQVKLVSRVADSRDTPSWDVSGRRSSIGGRARVAVQHRMRPEVEVGPGTTLGPYLARIGDVELLDA
jgi:hypothetical protein